jgi:hypothetical protein
MSQRNSNGFVLVVFVGLAMLMLYCASTFPIHIDEALTHRHFVSQGWKVAITTYPFPNNHVFFSLLASILVHLPIGSLLAMRLVSVFSGVLTLWLIFVIVKRNSNQWGGLLAGLIWVSSLGGFYYSVHARGYGLQTMLFLVCIYSILNYQEARKINKRGTAHLCLLVVSSALGFFTIPTFLFHFVSGLFALILLVTSNEGSIRKGLSTAVIVGSATTSLTLILYAPLFYFTGVGAITNNQWTQERMWQNLSKEQMMSFGIDLLAYIGPAVVAVLILGAILAVINRDGRFLNMLLVLTIPPVLIMLLTGTAPFPRTFTFLAALLTIHAFHFVHKYSLVYVRLFYVGAVIMLMVSTSTLVNTFVLRKDKQSVYAEEIQTDINQLIGSREIQMRGWNECAHLIDYYSWLKGHGPTVKFVYDQSKEHLQNSSTYWLSKEREHLPEGCQKLYEKAGLSLSHCN